jgi:hypothetical protein
MVGQKEVAGHFSLMLIARRALLVCLASIPLSCVTSGSPMPSSHDSPGPIVATPAGKLQGQREGALLIFKGIPFATPPLGSLRWKPPISRARRRQFALVVEREGALQLVR